MAKRPLTGLHRAAAMGTGGLGAAGVEREGVFFQSKAFGFGNRRLALFNLSVVKLFDPAAIEADQMIVVSALIELINGFATFKIAAREQACLLKLGEHAIYRCQTDVGALIEQNTVNVFRGHMPLPTGLKNLHDFQARQGGFEASVFEFFDGGHGAVGNGGQAATMD
jgi:hypothetical protein